MKTITLKLLAICLLLQFNLSAKTTFYVKADGTGNGTSWNDASGNIQNMIDKAEVGDEVWVAKGTYYPTLEMEARNARSKTFLLKDGVSLYGGFAGTEASIDSRQKSDLDENGTIEAWEFTNATILSGDVDGVEDVWKKEIDSDSIRWYWTVTRNKGNCYRIVTCNKKFINTTYFDGFAVTGGNNDKDKQGGGVKVIGKVTISNCIISKNSSSYGGGIYNYGGMITNCTIGENSSSSFSSYPQGIGVCNSGGTVINCTIKENHSYSYNSLGGGIHNSNGGVITDCVITGNTVFPHGSYGGGIYNYSGTVNSCVVSGNSSYSSSDGGGGIYNKRGTVVNCILKENSEGGIYNSEGIVYFCTIIKNSDFNYNESYNIKSYSCYNCLTYGLLNDNYALQEGSFAINSGSIENIPDSILKGKDFAGNPRILYGKPDLGASEYIMPTITLPFIETFDNCSDFFQSSYLYGSPKINGQNTMKWKIENQKAIFDYNAVAANKAYSETFFTYTLSGMGNAFVMLKYDMGFEAYSGSAITSIEQLSIEYSLDFENWEEIANHTNKNGNIANKAYQYDISKEVSGKDFYIRFRAHGENVNIIEKWEIDNISIESEKGETFINTINNSNVAIKSIENGISIETPETTTIAIYNISGQKVYESVINGSIEVYLPKGIYIVKAGKETFKTII